MNKSCFLTLEFHIGCDWWCLCSYSAVWMTGSSCVSLLAMTSYLTCHHYKSGKFLFELVSLHLSSILVLQLTCFCCPSERAPLTGWSESTKAFYQELGLVFTSWAVAKSEKFWQATGQSKLAYKCPTTTKASKVWFSYSHDCTSANGAVFHSVCQVWLSSGPQSFFTFSYCTWLGNWLIH